MPYTHLTSHERYCIAYMRAYKMSIRTIATRLSRSPSTISRELKRNNPWKFVYWYDAAEFHSQKRRSKPRTQKRRAYTILYDLVVKNVQQGFSPEIISGRLKREYRSSEMQVSHETIYQWIFADAKQGGDLYLSLVRHHKNRRKQRRSSKRKLFEGRVSINERPKIVADKTRFGDWESDTMEGGKSKGGLATHVERKSRYLVAGKVIDRRSDTFMQTTIKCFKCISPKLIKTFTVDNGSEFSNFRMLENETASKVYFADPYAPWQRGLNENTNGLLRRSFPKGCNFHEISDKVIKQVVEKLNHQPRKCLNFRTPYEVLFKTKTVALRT